MAIQEVLNKAGELVTLLQTELGEVRKKSEELTVDKASCAEVNKKLEAKATFLAAKERVLGKQEKLKEDQDKLAVDQKELRQGIAKLKVDQLSIDGRIKDLDEATERAKKAKEAADVRRNKAEAFEAELKVGEAARLKAMKELKGIL